VGSEYFINSQELENKVRNLLPSQGGAGAGFDLSASTQIIPIIDLTESAEGSNVRADLQTAISHTTATAFSVGNTTTTVINNTGYWRILGTCTYKYNGSLAVTADIQINDGATTKKVWGVTTVPNTANTTNALNIDFNVFLKAGDSLELTTSGTEIFLIGSVRQIADINGNLVNP
tara:strand:+ start:105 stop:629 length:525 start_codon:yes stop_codon:yes gene_type:complete